VRNRHEFRLAGVCPVDASTDHYDVVVETDRLLPVEKMLEVAADAVAEPRFQEQIARLISNRLGIGVQVTLVGHHSNVRTVSTAGPGWENETDA
jgi:hypothetical protein